MQTPFPQPQRTLAVLLGSDQWPRFPAVKGSPVFADSASHFHNYLCESKGLALPPSNVKNLFNDDRSPLDMLEEIKRWLRDHPHAEDLLVYYVGHGSPISSPNDYRLL